MNIKISENFHTPLDYFEIIFRNSINIILQKYYGKEWYFNNFLLDKQSIIIEELINKLELENKEINNANIVSNVSFGFWTSFFSGYYENKLKFLYSNIFNGKLNRDQIFKKIIKIKNLRNRIAHRENIIKYYFMNDFGTIMQLISFIDKDISIYINNNTNLKQIFESNKDTLMKYANYNNR